MSGYLARLAARAGGGPAAAGPRIPSRFEPSTPDGPTDAETPGALAHDRHSRERGAETLVDERAPAEAPARAVAALPVPADHRPHGGEAEAAAPAPRTNAAVHPRHAPEREKSAAFHPPAAAALRVEAAPPPRAAARPSVAEHRDEAAAAPTEPDVVHVRIERIEVRATVAAAPPIARSAPQRRDPERSLHDYLAGKSR